MAALVEHPDGKAFLLNLVDQIFRPRSLVRAAGLMRQLVAQYGPPAEAIGFTDRGLARIGALMSAFFPALVMKAIRHRVRADAAPVILPATVTHLDRHLARREREGFRVTLNLLGEAVLGEQEAEARLRAYEGRLADPRVGFVSVKLSSILSQIHLAAYRHTVDEAKARLRRLYRTAVNHPRHGEPKYVHLDMEEYRDLRLTLDAFREVLSEPEFQKLRAGVVLQAYLPDSFAHQQILTRWARERVAAGGAPVKVRLVKGANLAMEKVEAELRGWPAAPFSTKPETDASFKKMLEFGTRPENAAAVNLGVGSHNLFDVAYALILRERRRVARQVEIEMLEGMAPQQSRAVNRRVPGLLLYAPVVDEKDFPSAIAYLVRRLDENSSDENYLRSLFSLTPGSPAWEAQKGRFFQAFDLIPRLDHTPRRKQDRAAERRNFDVREPFQNEPDTDFSLAANQAWLETQLAGCLRQTPLAIPLHLGAGEARTGDVIEGVDPSRPGVVPYTYCRADADTLETALATGDAASAGWAGQPIDERRQCLERAAENLARARGELIGAMVMDGGKNVLEADAEISEAIDFIRYYARAFEEIVEQCRETRFRPRGLTVVAPPWNFPLAIPAGGVAAALVCGNPVILKPAPQTVYVAWKLARHLWDAGVPPDVLQFLPAPENEIGRRLITDPRVQTVVLTGAYDTARTFLDWKPELHLCAETSGKNSFLITAAADLDLAVKDLVKSAFGHSGQKCSAASLAIVEAEVYENPDFRRKLKDAAASLPRGGAWDPANVVTPLIDPPSGPLRRVLNGLEPGQSWLLRPTRDSANPRMWSPGILLGVTPSSWYRSAECFGPVLGLMKASGFKEGLALQNQSRFGLTAGLHSLDFRETDAWIDAVEAGNIYVNRGMTGAIVRRQPFGGWKHSAVGSGLKAGGPNYVLNFVSAEVSKVGDEHNEPRERWKTLVECCGPSLERPAGFHAALEDYPGWWERFFSKSEDPTGLRCEANVLRYRPRAEIVFRLSKDRPFDDLAAAVAAAAVCGTPLEVSLAEPHPAVGRLEEGGWIKTSRVETDAKFSRSLAERQSEAVRWPECRNTEALRLAHRAGVMIFTAPVSTLGRLELLYYMREQSVSVARHRYGNLIRRPAG